MLARHRRQIAPVGRKREEVGAVLKAAQPMRRAAAFQVDDLQPLVPVAHREQSPIGRQRARADTLRLPGKWLLLAGLKIPDPELAIGTDRDHAAVGFGEPDETGAGG
jgi:hypothetical protein